MNSQDQIKETSKALKLSIVIALSLAVCKFVAGALTHSMAILASALDSLMDVASSTVNFVASRKAAKPPDEDHAYGHEKIESLAGLFQSSLIGLTGLILLYEAVKRMFSGGLLQSIPLGILVMGFSMLLTVILVWRLHQAEKRHGSTILSAEKLHYVTDILHNLGVMLALAMVHWTGAVIWDLVFAVLVFVYILRAASQIFRRSIDELLDKSLPPAANEKIKNEIMDFHPAITGIHEFRSRRVGPKIFLDFHIEISGEDDFKRAHLMTESLIDMIRIRYPAADVTVHYDPAGEE